MLQTLEDGFYKASGAVFLLRRKACRNRQAFCPEFLLEAEASTQLNYA
jgi:hypothetical protein